MSHWTKLDHVAFMLMLPMILLSLLVSAFSVEVKGDVMMTIAFLNIGCFFLWMIALCYDIWEEWKGDE